MYAPFLAEDKLDLEEMAASRFMLQVEKMIKMKRKVLVSSTEQVSLAKVVFEDENSKLVCEK